jgi:hypothetical protein
MGAAEAGLPLSWSARRAEQAVAAALRRLLRGGTWPGLVRELAWNALTAAGGDPAWLDELEAAVEAQLAERVEAAEYPVEQAATRAVRAHLEEHPHDYEGAELVGGLAADEEAVRVLALAYRELLETTEDTVHDRLARRARPRRFRPATELSLRRPGPAAARPPALVTGDLDRPADRFGWPRQPR